MDQIVKRKKKGRPSKADLASRAAAEEQPGAAERRSLRRRSVRYTFDLDDYVDEDELEEDEEEEEAARRREKKLKLLLKVKEEGGSTGSAPSGTRRVGHAPAASASSSDYGANSPFKKRKIDSHDDAYANGVVDDGVEEV